MARSVQDLLPGSGRDSEKITINLGFIDLGHIDLLVRDGFYANRTDFIRTAIRNQVERHADATRQSVSRRSLDLGLRHFSREGEALSDAQADRIAGLKGLAAHAAQAVAKAEPAAAKAADAARKAAERLARAEQGEDVGGGGMPLTHKGFLKITDMTKAEARDCERVAEIVERGGSQLLADEQLRRHRKVDKAVVRELHRLLLP